MGNDFKCRVETMKIVWLIGLLIIVSILIIQYFELPYRESIFSLLSSDKAYFNSSDANGKQSYVKNNSFPSMPNLEDEEMTLPENTAETIESSSDKSYEFSKENAVSDISPSFSTFTEKIIDDAYSNPPISSRIASSPSASLGAFSLAPMVTPSKSVGGYPRNMDLNLANENQTSWKSENGKLKSDNVQLEERSSCTTNNPPTQETPESPLASVVSIYEMNDMLIRSRESSYSKSPLWPSSADQELLDARFKIEHSPIVGNHPGLYGPIYRNLSAFIRSYEIMEQKLKIYIYKDGEKPVFHQPRLKGIYASEGWFMKQLEASNRFVTKNSEEAHLFYLPFSSQLLVDFVYVRDSHTFRDINEYLKNYINTIKTRYSLWNRTDGGDHFLVACHDWAPIETRRLMSNCIRALCNSDIKEGFQFGKDVSLPETYVHSPQNPSKEIGGMPPSKRKILAFFAGQMHGSVRPILLQHWENKDPDMKIFGRMRKGYAWHMKNSKYCICAKGYEVNSPRVVEAILYGCVPVIISDNFVPPFFDSLKWDSFAVFVPERDIPNLRNILVSISDKRYVVMQMRVKMVRQHFIWHNKPVKYDIFHMILHSVWYNKVLQTAPK